MSCALLQYVQDAFTQVDVKDGVLIYHANECLSYLVRYSIVPSRSCRLATYLLRFPDLHLNTTATGALSFAQLLLNLTPGSTVFAAGPSTKRITTRRIGTAGSRDGIGD